MPPTDRFVSETSFFIRYAETDAMRIVHHASYLVYLEEGRSHFLRDQGTNYADFEHDGLFLAVTDVSVRYHHAAHYGQRIKVLTWVEAIQSRGLTFSYELFEDAGGTKLVTATTRHICIDSTGTVTRIPTSWRRFASH